jgi:hypothetical protein
MRERRVMILTDPVLPGPHAAAPEKLPVAAIPHAALARLPLLRDQARHDLELLFFLARVPQACLILLAAGACVLIWTRLSTGPAALEREFVWASLVLTGIAAMTGLHIMSYAKMSDTKSGPALMPPHIAALTLRRLLFYTGIAWGTGAFLTMPGQPSPALGVCFAAAPCLGLGLLLGDQKGTTAFTAPVILATASAAYLQSWPYGLWVATILLATGMAVFCLPMLQREISTRRDGLPISPISVSRPPI